MNYLKRLQVLTFILLLGSFGCATVQPVDYSLYRQQRPKTILVLPPLNRSNDVRATYSYLSTVTHPIAEKGYYVFPVAVIDQMMKENGLPTPGEMHQASLAKINEIIHPDAVLYITIDEYGSTYQVVSQSIQVGVSARLVSARDGAVLWEGRSHVLVVPDQGGQAGLLGLLISSALHQVLHSSSDSAHDVCRAANHQLFELEGRGLLPGPYLPDFAQTSQGQ
ncbi:MAG: DUF799 domain-containing protein [Bdellovibrionia bacterium]